MTRYSKIFLYLCCLFAVAVSMNSYGQSTDNTDKINKKWIIVLPLRFTQLQSTNTMLSGIKLGRVINQKFITSVSVYHSFYLNSFKAEAHLKTFDKQPRLFINCVGVEPEYYFFRKNKMAASMQLLLGWGFMKYDLEHHNFTSKQVNYFATEPLLNLEYKLNQSTSVGLGIGYRPILSTKKITYSSDLGRGEIPLQKTVPNGANVVLALKGFL